MNQDNQDNQDNLNIIIQESINDYENKQLEKAISESLETIDYNITDSSDSKDSDNNYNDNNYEDIDIEKAILNSLHVPKIQNMNKIEEDRLIREQQDKEYSESLLLDTQKNIINSKQNKENINYDATILSRDELREARLKFFNKK